MQIADRIEREVVSFVERWVQSVQRVCRQVVRQVVQWHRRWETVWVTVTRQACTWLPWPLSSLCRWITESVRRLVEVVVRVVVSVLEMVCELVTSLVRTVVRIVTTVVLTVVRFMCFWVGFIVSWIRIVIAALVGIPDFLACLLGLQLRKRLLVCVTTLADEKREPVIDDPTVSGALARAAEIILQQTGVRIQEVGRKIVAVPEDRLDVTACNAEQLFSAEAVDLSSEGASPGPFGEIFGCGEDLEEHVTGIVHGILNVIFIRNIIEGDDIGCHIPGTDYVIVDRLRVDLLGETLAHEIGHACDLWHIDDATNLMNPSVGGLALRSWQRCIFRRARWVHYSPF